MQKLLDDVFYWSWQSPAHGYPFNGYLLRLPGCCVCVDPVQAEEHDLNELCAARPQRILLTNRNHARMSNLLRERTSARVAIHPADAEHARSQGAHIDDALSIGERIGPLEVVGLPGKSQGEVGFYWAERRLLLVGDALIGNPPGSCSLLRPQVVDDMAELQRSVRAALRLDFDTLLVGDGEPILGGAHRAVAELLARLAA